MPRWAYPLLAWITLAATALGCTGRVGELPASPTPDGASNDGGSGISPPPGSDGGAPADAADAAVDPGPDGGAIDRIVAPLVVDPDNPRYFRDGHGRTVRLGGHQVHMDLQDHAFDHPSTYGGETLLDWAWYLDFATERNLNAVRNWTVWSTGSTADEARRATPMMYQRTGTDLANDGLPRFDLTRFNQDFFDRMRARVEAAQERGIYVTIMLFEVYGFGGPTDGDGGHWMYRGNVFNGDNNVNGIDVDEDGNGWGIEFFYTTDETVLALQRAYVEKVIDTVGDLDNVLYEVANELYAPDWQRAMIAHVRAYEAGRPKQHPTYMSPGGRSRTGSWRAMTYDDVRTSGADVIGVMGSFGDFTGDPPVDESGMPVIWDGDHIWGDDWQHRRRAWMAFTRGYHFIYYDHPFERPDEATPEDELMRWNVGGTNRYAERFLDLSRMEPRGDLSSTGYCLADPGTEYLVYAPAGGTVTLDLEAGTYDLEWFDCRVGQPGSADVLEASGGADPLTPPAEITEDFALHLRARR